MGSITINSNLASLNAQRRLSVSTSSLQDAFIRLSSGLRINTASDDAAGLAIAESLNVDRRVYDQGIRNLNDGVSLLSIADGALNELTGITVRLAELAEQAANGSLSNVQRRALDEEGQALKAEYFRIAQTTAFNGQKLFDGNLGRLRLQAGYGEDGGVVSGLGGAIGDGTFTSGTTQPVGSTPYDLQMSDFNGDGILDVVTADSASNTLSVLFGTGNGAFAAATSYATGVGPRSVETADVNGDGVMDLLAAASTDQEINVFLGAGDGTFGSAMTLNMDSAAYSVRTGDFDGDGNLDIATASSVTGSVGIFRGVGDGTFGTVTTFAAGNGSFAADVADFNGDGILDIATADLVGNTTSVLLGVGDGTFGAATSYSVGTEPRDIESGDFNGDGILDLVASNVQDATVSVRLGVGDGTFGSEAVYATGFEPRAMALGDFDGDGQVDIATADGLGDTVSILLGNADGSFAAGTSFATGDGPLAVAAGDINRDGVLDLVTADFNANAITSLPGNTTDGVAPLLDFSLKTQADARQALPIFEQKLNQLSSQRGQIGAFEARLGTAIATAQSASTSFRAAESRIRDADVAAEAARLAKYQILQQAGVAILGQANQQPALALSLLS